MKTAAAIALLFPCLAFNALAHAEPPHVSIGRVVSAGEDVVGIQNGFSGAIHEGDPLVPDEHIETASNSATLLLHEGTISAAIKIRPHSRVRLVAEAGKGIQVQLESGGVLSDVHNPEKRPNAYQIRTRTAVMGVRGTLFFVKELPGQSTFLCTCHGEVALERVGEKDASQAVVIQGKHHDHPMTIREEADGSTTPMSARTSPAPQGNEHSDSDGAELEKVLSAMK